VLLSCPPIRMLVVLGHIRSNWQPYRYFCILTAWIVHTKTRLHTYDELHSLHYGNWPESLISPITSQ
jgi:hypothetical protein